MTEDLIGTILSRRSIRKYAPEPISDEQIQRILEAAMAAPSASNRKPWHFVIVKNKKVLNTLAENLQYGKMLHEAALCIAVCGDTAISERFWVQDCSAATENILLAATALGLGSVWLGIYPGEDRVKMISELLRIPENIVPLSLISIGHPAENKEARTQFDKMQVHFEEW